VTRGLRAAEEQVIENKDTICDVEVAARRIRVSATELLCGCTGSIPGAVKNKRGQERNED
jgi:hypothetical protein